MIVDEQEASPEEWLVRLIRLGEESERRRVDWYLHRRNHVAVGAILTGMAGLAEARGIQAYFVERNIAGLKQNFYLAGKLILASLGQQGGAELSLPGDLRWALLSDNAELIDAFARVETPSLLRERADPRAGRFHVYMLQQAILGNDEVVQAMIEKIARSGGKPQRDECARGEDFYSLLLRRDQPALEILIRDKHARIKAKYTVADEFMAYLATLETKLCWFRGIPAQVDHPRVPMELMPVRPLDRYDDVYEFLKPGWVPPTQGWLAKARRWLKR